MTIQRDAMMKAVEALNGAKYAIKGREHTGFIDKAIAALRAALAEQELDAQKPPEPSDKDACLSDVQPMKSAEEWVTSIGCDMIKQPCDTFSWKDTIEAIQQNALASVRGGKS